MAKDQGVVGRFVDSCEFNRLESKDALSVLGCFMAVCKIGKLNPRQTASVLADFMNSCEANGLDPEDGLAELHAQESDGDPISDGQLKEINRLMGLIVGEPTEAQLEEITRLVMTASS